MPVIKNNNTGGKNLPASAPDAPLIIPKREIKEEPEDNDVIITNFEPYGYAGSSEYRRRDDSHRHQNQQNQNLQNSGPSTSDLYGESSGAPTLNERFGGAPSHQYDEDFSSIIRSYSPIYTAADWQRPEKGGGSIFYGGSPEYVEDSNSGDQYSHSSLQNDSPRYRLNMTPPPQQLDYENKIRQERYARQPRSPERSRRRETRYSERGLDDYGYGKRRRDYSFHRRSPSPAFLHHSSRKRKNPIPYLKPKRHEIPLDNYSDEEDTEVTIQAPKIVHPVPKSAVESLTGNLSLITELTNCELELIPDLLDYMEYQNVELKGTAEQNAEARERLDEWIITDQEYRQRDLDEVKSILYVPVPEEVRDVVCSRKELRRVEMLVGACSVEVAKSTEQFPPVRIRGTVEDVLNGKEEIQRLIAKRQKETEGRIEEKIRIPKSCVGKVMGRGGETVSMIRKTTDVVRSSLLPDTGRDYRVMEVVGKAEQVKLFKEQVYAIIDDVMTSRDAPEDTDEGVFRIQLKHTQVGRLIGRRGRTIREIRERSGAKVMVDEETPSVTVSGERLEADYARHLIYQQIGEIDKSAPYEDLSHYDNLSKVKRTRWTKWKPATSSE